MNSDPPSPLRTIVLLLGIVEAAALLAFMALLQGSTDPLGKAIGQGMTVAAAVPLLTLVLPALTLGFANRWLGWALALLILAVPVSGLLWVYA